MQFRNCQQNNQQPRPSGERAWRDCLEEECLQLSERCNEHSRVLGVPYHFRVEDETEALLTRRDVLGKRSRELEQDIVRKKIEVSFSVVLIYLFTQVTKPNVLSFYTLCPIATLLFSSLLFSPFLYSVLLSSIVLISCLLSSHLLSSLFLSSPLLSSPLLSSPLLSSPLLPSPPLLFSSLLSSPLLSPPCI